MSQEDVLAMIRAFGPLRSCDLKKAMRHGSSSIHPALKTLQHTGEIISINPDEGPRGSGRARWWVVP